MAYSLVTFWNFFDAESNDTTCEKHLGTNVAVQNTAGRQQTGSYGYSSNYNLTGSQVIGPGVQGVITATNIFVLSFAAGVDAAPSATAPIFVRKVSSSYYNHIILGTDRSLRFYDKNGNQVGSASITVIPTTGMQEVVVVFDGTTLSTVYIKVYFGDTEELAFDTGKTPDNFWDTSNGEFYFGDPNNGSDKNFVLYSDDVVIRSSSTAGDAPHLIAYPRLRGAGGITTPPTSVGTYDAWDAPVGAPTKYEAVDDPGVHDGDTTYVNTFTKGASQTFKYAAANPTPNPCTIEFVQLRDVGKKTVDKMGAHFKLRLGGTDVPAGSPSGSNDATPSTSYSGGVLVPVSRPGGGSWTRADAEPDTLEFGWQGSNNASFNTGAQITKQPGPTWVYYTDTLPLGTTPTVPVGKIKQLNQAVKRASLY